MPACEPVIYQLKVVLQGISPMIWRRLLVCGDSTIADLHYIVQIAMDGLNRPRTKKSVTICARVSAVRRLFCCCNTDERIPILLTIAAEAIMFT